MSFEEIGERMGTSKTAAFMLYRYAITKIRRSPEIVETLRLFRLLWNNIED